MSNITISPKHGLNPTIPRCFFCGEPKNELVLLGKLKGDAEAPKDAVFDYQPCEKCQKAFKAGILLIGVTTVQPADRRPPIQKGLYPTGGYMLVKEDLIRRILSEEEAKEVIEKRICFMEQPILDCLDAEHKKLLEEK